MCLGLDTLSEIIHIGLFYMPMRIIKLYTLRNNPHMPVLYTYLYTNIPFICESASSGYPYSETLIFRISLLRNSDLQYIPTQKL